MKPLSRIPPLFIHGSFILFVLSRCVYLSLYLALSL